MKAAGCCISVRLKPGASREKIVSVDNNLACIAVMAPPVEGRANEALLKFLGKVLGAPQSSLGLRRGLASRNKLVEITGMTKEQAMEKLREACLNVHGISK